MISLKTSAAAYPNGSPRSLQASTDSLSERDELLIVDGLHRALELADVCLEGVKLAVDELPALSADIFDVIGLVCLEQQQRPRAVSR